MGYSKGKTYPKNFYPQNKDKFKGHIPCIARSSWEFKAFSFFDRNSSILEWGSETTIIKYISLVDKKQHRYFTDLTCKMRTKDGIKRVIIEIKPDNQIRPPVKKKGQHSKTFIRESVEYLKNKSKWTYAIKYCKKRNIKFAIWTEKGFTFLI